MLPSTPGLRNRLLFRQRNVAVHVELGPALVCLGHGHLRLGLRHLGAGLDHLGARDLPLLCELAALGLPDLDPESGALSDRALHVRSGGTGGADALYGHLVRAAQEGRAPPEGRASYFRRDAA